MPVNSINTAEWLDENKDSFVPPVCNKLMYGAGQLKIMYVGGPNTRKDYHIEEGEEVMEQGKPKDVVIREGEVFLLPCHVPHSPQRSENTVGLVIEREREQGEEDCLRYYCDDNKTILFERWFHCTDLGKDLAPIVQSYFASEQHKTGKPIPGTITVTPPFDVDTTTKLQNPFLLEKWISANREEIKVKGSKMLFDTRQTKVKVIGPGEQSTNGDPETWLWQIDGSTHLDCNGVSQKLEKNDVILIPVGTKFSCEGESDSITISVIMDPKIK